MSAPSKQALWASQVLVDCLREAGDDIDAGFAAAEYILSTESESYDYPRNRSNQFLSKILIAEAARDDLKYRELRDSLPEDQCWKLDHKIAVLQGGGTVHHPNENPGLGVNIDGLVVDLKWATHELETKCREEWEAREAKRSERRKFANKAVRSFRSESRPLDRVGSLLKKAGATPAEMRTLIKLRHDLDRKKIPPGKFERLYEEVMESVHLRIDKECSDDPEREFLPSTAFAIDRRGVAHRAGGPGGGQFVPHGQEGSESANQEEVSPQRQKKRQFAKKRKEVTEQVGKKAKEVAEVAGQVAGQAASQAMAAEHFAANWTAERVEALPAGLRVPLKAIYYAAFGTFIAGQKAARAVAAEVGGEEHADRVATTLATIDTVTALGAKAAGIAGVHGPTTVPLVVPVASASYLAYASVRHPVATFNAATKGVGAALERLKGGSKEAGGPSENYKQQMPPEVAKETRAVGEDGTPITMYFGSRKPLKKGLSLPTEEGGTVEPGIYLTEHPEIARRYAGESGNVLQAHIRTKNPLDITKPLQPEDLKRLTDSFREHGLERKAAELEHVAQSGSEDPFEWFSALSGGTDVKPDVWRKAMLKAGYDAVKHEDYDTPVKHDDGTERYATNWMVLDPSQVYAARRQQK